MHLPTVRTLTAFAAACLLHATPVRAMLLTATNHWAMGPDDALDGVALVVAPSIEAAGRAYDDSFWIATDRIDLNGRFDNDVWALGSSVTINGFAADHARLLGQRVAVNGAVSNGLWAIAQSITIPTNATLFGQQFLIGDTILLNGHIEGDVWARGRSITLGGSIVGNIHLQGDDIVVRPGTTIIGNFYYVTTNQTIVLDAASNISGEMLKIEPPALNAAIPPTWSFAMLVFFSLAAFLTGIPFMLAFPSLTGHSIFVLRSALWKCGLAGLALMFGLPFVIFAAAMSIVGLPLALVLGAGYALLLYLGKIPVALVLGATILNRRGEVSLGVALLSLVIGLLLIYSLGVLPYLGSTLQTMASVFGAGSLVLGIAARRGNLKMEAVNRVQEVKE